METIACLGLGAMGSRMAMRLLQAGYNVKVWNRSAQAAAPLIAAGAVWADSPNLAAQGAAYVFSMLTDDQAAEQVWLGTANKGHAQGALQGMAKGAVAIECSTVSPNWIAKLHARAALSGIALLDAPVAGSRPQADAGQLIFFIGGEALVAKRVAPVLEKLGHKQLYMGSSGKGTQFKLAVNSFFATQLLGLANWLSVLEKAGFERMAVASHFAELPITAPPLAGALKMMAVGEGPTLFTIDLLSKDIGYACAMVESLGSDAALIKADMHALQCACALGLGGENISSLAKAFV